MVIKANRYLLYSVLLFVFALVISEFDETVSDEDCETYNYSDCNTIEPFEAELSMAFSISKNIRMVPFEIYKGSIEENIILLKDTAWSSKVKYTLEIPEYYSVRARYVIDGKTIYTVDGVKMDKKSVQKCDSICWKDSNKELDLTLQ
jgi:hypothetical protein